MDAKTWTAIINEGGEGYNPYTAKKESEPAWSKVADMYHRVCKVMDSTSASDHEYAKLTAKRDALKTSYIELMAQDK